MCIKMVFLINIWDLFKNNNYKNKKNININQNVYYIYNKKEVFLIISLKNILLICFLLWKFDNLLPKYVFMYIFTIILLLNLLKKPNKSIFLQKMFKKVRKSDN